MEQHEHHEKILLQLEHLNNRLERQGMIRYQFREGIIKGIGFFIGSAILATILLGILGPIFGDIQWVRDTYQTGEEILQ